MKQLATNYSFNAVAKTVTLTGLDVPLNYILLIVNATCNQIIYNLAEPSLGAAAYQQGANSVLFLKANLDGMANSDQLTIFYDNGAESQIVLVQGPVGPIGPQGSTGEPGVQGIQGPKGDTGDVGPQGPIGPVGPQGVQGPQGTTSWDGITDKPTAAQIGAEPAITILSIEKGGTGANRQDFARESLGIPEPQAYTLYEHFLQGNLAINNLRNLTGGGGSSASALPSRIYDSTGVVTLVTGTSAVVAHSAFGIDQVNENAIDLWRAPKNIFSSRAAFFQLPTASVPGLWYSGFIDTYNGPSVNGAYFRIVNDRNLQCVVVSNGFELVQELDFRPAVGQMNLYEVVVYDNGNEVGFFFNGSRQATFYSLPGGTQRVNYGTGIVRTTTANTTSLEFDLDLIFVRLYNTGFSLKY